MSLTRTSFARAIQASSIAILVGLSATEAPSQRAPSPRVYTTQVCKAVATPWPGATPRIDRVTTTTTLLDRQWLGDPIRGQSDLTRVLATNSTLLRFAVENASGCKDRSCACPRAAKTAATTLSQTLDPSLARDSRTALDRLFRQDSVATFTGTMIFLREHPEFVRHVSDSLARARGTAVRSVRTPVRARPPGA